MKTTVSTRLNIMSIEEVMAKNNKKNILNSNFNLTSKYNNNI